VVPKVMIVDDDRTTVRLLQTLLELDGFEVVVAPCGAEVLPLAQQDTPDLFLMDYNLSDVTGAQLAAILRQQPEFAQTPIVIASGMSVEREARAAGASAFLMKPFDPGQLQRLFQRLIESEKDQPRPTTG
jgi:CheY-like chemotaxis protein